MPIKCPWCGHAEFDNQEEIVKNLGFIGSKFQCSRCKRNYRIRIKLVKAK